MSVASAAAGLYAPGVSPGNVPWPGGVVPYVFDAGIPAAKQAIYLNGLREYELAANVHFVPRAAETQYIVFKFDPQGPNRVSGSQPVTVEVNSLARGQICHEMGHAFGLEHEHQRPDRDGYVEVLSANIVAGNEALFAIASGATMHGAYDFESVMHYGRDTLSTQPGTLDTLRAKAGYEKYQTRMGNVALSPGDRALMAFLYGPPAVAPSAVVTTTADGGPGSLRAAMYYATDHPGTPVSFNIPTSDPNYSGGTWTIRPKAWLPPLAKDGIKIDGSTQPGAAALPRVQIAGTDLATEEGQAPGFLILEGDCEIQAMGVSGYPWCGINLSRPDATGNRILNCTSKLNLFQGIQISEGARDNLVEGCVLSGNNQYGLWMSEGQGNEVRNCKVGTTADGTAALANQSGGIILTGGTHHDTVEGNLLSGNKDAGLWVTGEGVDQHVIRNNRIGTNAAGTAAIPNTFAGVYVLDGAADNLLEWNLFSGNAQEGLRLAGVGTTGNTVRGNFAGTTASGTAALGNGFAGITLFQGASNNRIEDNVMSGNGSVGLAIRDAGTTANRVYRNFIGTNAAGTATVPNAFAGVDLSGGSSGNFLGEGPGSGNLISGNAVYGAFVADAGPGGNAIRNNRIGPDVYGVAAFTNQFDAIAIGASANGTTVGGSEPGAANLIRGNAGRGIVLFETGATGNSFRRNSIGGNGWDGIAMYNGANHGIAAPVISAAVLGIGTTVTGSFTGAPNASYRIEYFASAAAGTNGEMFLGDKMVNTNGGGATAIDIVLPASVQAGRFVTVTATAISSGDTSVFSNAALVTTSDSDGDGMPDAYEDSVVGLNKTNAADAAGDLDGDGMSNLQEFRTGTDPRNANSRLLLMAEKSAGGASLKFPSVAGVIYRIEAADDLPGVWQMAAVNLLGSGVMMELELPSTSRVRFYRLVAGE
ncbi:M12 family metallopeptidase [Haloferula sp. BvORR071]|uniref:M12 family metallopeptidase n=1 Tax=Haloferula sp. BvORR071 TaxID=1396141 RepID=UPI002240F6D3|nr:M12 family metallopeptidase [Haloferula sp. BvORR071]